MFPEGRGRVPWELFKLLNQLWCKQSIFVNVTQKIPLSFNMKNMK